MMTAAQLRAARALLGIDQRTLADMAGVSLPTIQRLEASDGNVRGIIETLTKVIEALNEAGIEAVEAKLTVQDLHEADEIFSCGNYGKLVVCNRFEDRSLNAGPIFQEAKRLYWQWAETTRVA